MAKNKADNNMSKPVQILHYNADLPGDQELIGLANEYGRLPENKGLPLAALIRNLLERTLRQILKQHKNDSTEAA